MLRAQVIFSFFSIRFKLSGNRIFLTLALNLETVRTYNVYYSYERFRTTAIFNEALGNATFWGLCVAKRH